jgi:hypothetical protein
LGEASEDLGETFDRRHLLECLSAGSVNAAMEAACPCRGILARFGDLLEAEPLTSIAEISAALGVSDQTLRECCKQHLGTMPRPAGFEY